jgi:hypothetical protein
MDSIAEITLPWRGRRDYVQGADLCDAMLEALDGRGAMSELSFSVHDMVRVHRMEMLSLRADEAARLAEFAVRLRLRLDGAPHLFVLRPAAGEGPEGVDDHEAAIWAAARRDGETIAAGGPSDLGPLATAVSLKKRLMLDLHPERTGKWIFCRLDAPAPPAAGGAITVRFRQSVRSIFLSDVTFGADEPSGVPARMSFMVTG